MLLQNYISGHQKLYNSDVPADKESLSRQVNIRSRRLLRFTDLQVDVSNFPGGNLIATNDNHYYTLMVIVVKVTVFWKYTNTGLSGYLLYLS